MTQDTEADLLLHRSELLARERAVDPKLVDALESLTRAFYDDKLRKARKVGAKILRKVNPEQMPLVYARTQLLFGFALLFGKGETKTPLEHIEEGIAVLEQDEFREYHLEELADVHRQLAMFFGALAAEFSDDNVDLWAGAYEHGRAALDFLEDGQEEFDLVFIVAQSAHALAPNFEDATRNALLRESIAQAELALEHISSDDSEVREHLAALVVDASQQLEAGFDDSDGGNWDLFVSHASEDKAELVAPLTSALDAFGVRVWYDEFQIDVGESLDRSIDEGLARSNYGLVVLSPAFFNKEWTEYELEALVKREGESSGVLISVWHNITYEEIAKINPVAAKLPHVVAGSNSAVQLAAILIKKTRPDIMSRIAKRMMSFESYEKAETEEVRIGDLGHSPRRHEELPPRLIGQIRLIRALFLGSYTQTMAFWVEGFERDANPSKNVREWLRMASVIREAMSYFGYLQPPQLEALTKLILGAGIVDKQTETQIATVLQDDAVPFLHASLASDIPVADIQDEFPARETISGGAVHLPVSYVQEHNGSEQVSDVILCFAGDAADHAAAITETYALGKLPVHRFYVADGAGTPDSAAARSIVVIVSAEFLKKAEESEQLRHWLDAAAKAAGDATLIPVWMEINEDQIAEICPGLANTLALNASEFTAETLAIELLKMTHADCMSGVHRALAWQYANDDLDDSVNFDDIYFLPVFNDQLADQDVARVRCIRAGLLMIYPHSMIYWTEGFRREPDLEGELRKWERISACLHEYISLHPVADSTTAMYLYRYLLHAAAASDWSVEQTEEPLLPAEHIEIIKHSLTSDVPHIEIEGGTAFAADEDDDGDTELAAFFGSLDKENLEHDLPEDLVRQLMSQ